LVKAKAPLIALGVNEPPLTTSMPLAAVSVTAPNGATDAAVPTCNTPPPIENTAEPALIVEFNCNTPAVMLIVAPVPPKPFAPLRSKVPTPDFVNVVVAVFHKLPESVTAPCVVSTLKKRV
jgi:hypothetical protein